MFDKIHKYEIEISSYCNRKCDWCSNKIISRNFRKIMKEELFIKILNELQYNNCNREDITVTFSKFNEPTADMELLFLRSSQLKLYLPKATLSINTNGDFLDTRIFNYPINILGIMDYDGKGVNYGYNLLKGYGATEITEMNNQLYANINGISVRFFFNWTKNFFIEDRGNLLHDKNLKWRNFEEHRTMPCLVENRPISIDYLGNVTPCCHIRADELKHQQYVMGNLYGESLQEIFQNDRFLHFNRIMEGGNDNQYFFPCWYCHKIRC